MQLANHIPYNWDSLTQIQYIKTNQSPLVI